MCNDLRRAPVAAERGFNLIELMMSMAVATVMFMALTTLFVRQSEQMLQQTELIVLHREARFGLEHLRADLGSLASNSTPNSVVDPLTCPKPEVPLRALSVAVDNSFVSSAALNPNVQPASLTFFGSLDIKTRYRSAAISGSKVTLFDDGNLPKSQAEYDDIFSVDRYVRISGSDGRQMFFAIASASESDRSVTVVGQIPQIGNGVTCGYQGLGVNYNVDVQNFVRYRITADVRPGAPTDPGGQPTQSLLVRERLAVDGVTPKAQLILVENAVDLQLFDVGMDMDPAPDNVKLKVYPLTADVAAPGGDGFLGTTTVAHPEALRFLTVKLSVRTQWPTEKLVHTPREVAWQPLKTWQLSTNLPGRAHPVITTATRIALPTLVSRNL